MFVVNNDKLKDVFFYFS